MDPNATLRQLLEELAQPEPDRANAAHLAVALSEWLARDGALPTVNTLNTYTFEVGR